MFFFVLLTTFISTVHTRQIHSILINLKRVAQVTLDCRFPVALKHLGGLRLMDYGL